MDRRLAIIDLGTNTFHLLVVDLQADMNFTIVHKEKIFVKLGEFGLPYFKSEIIERALNTLLKYKTHIEQYGTEEVLIFGTAALRMSSNTDVLVSQVKEKCGWEIQVISGEKEAALIYHGVKQTYNLNEKTHLIMDIGGGSVEFILANAEQVLWSGSFNIGAALLRKKFHVHEPISNIEIQQLNSYLVDVLLPLENALENFPTERLIGASGSFDTVADLSLIENNTKVAVELPIDKFNQICEDLLLKNLEQRLSTQKLVPERADMIVVSLILIQHVLKRFNIQFLYKSDYALKEGILWAYENEQKLLRESGKLNFSILE